MSKERLVELIREATESTWTFSDLADHLLANGVKVPTKDKTKSYYHKSVLYTVWNNKTDEIVIVDGNAVECAKAMGISVRNFYSTVSKNLNGTIAKWTIEKRRAREVEENDT